MQQNVLNLCNSKELVNRCKAITNGNDVYKDLVNHTLVIILELNARELNKISNLNNYACGIAYNEYRNKYSSFNKSMGSNETVELSGIEIECEETNIDKEHSILIKFINLDLIETEKKDRLPVQKIVFETYLELKTIRATAAHFDISRSTVHRFVTDYKNRIKTAVNESNK